MTRVDKIVTGWKRWIDEQMGLLRKTTALGTNSYGINVVTVNVFVNRSDRDRVHLVIQYADLPAQAGIQSSTIDTQKNMKCRV